jgi:arylsulfatase
VTLNLKNKSHAVTAEVVFPEGNKDGVIVTQGGKFGGWSLYVHQGRLKYCYNLLGVEQFYTEATTQLPSGKHQVRMEFAYDGGGLAKGGDISLYVDGNKVGEGRVGATMPRIFSCDETMDVGCESGSMVSEDYTDKTSKFKGRIEWVQLDQGADDHDHLISPEERWHLAMTRQ